MATKMMKKTLAILLALTLMFSLTSMVTHAGYQFDFGDFDFGYDDDYKPEDGKNDKEDKDNKDNKGDKHGSGTEYVGITLDNGEVIKVSEGENGDHTYLTNGTYGQASAEIKDDNTIIIKVNTSNGEQTFEGKLSEGYTFDSIDDPTGVNSQSASFDNLIFNINTSKKEPTEPTDPTDPVDPSEPQGPEIIITPVDPTDPVDPVEPADEPDEDYERPERPHYSPKQDEEELPPVEEIVEEEVPLSDVPAEEPVEEPAEEPVEEIVEEIPEEEVPLADVPATGDPMVLYTALSAISGIGLAWLGLKKD